MLTVLQRRIPRLTNLDLVKDILVVGEQPLDVGLDGVARQLPRRE